MTGTGLTRRCDDRPARCGTLDRRRRGRRAGLTLLDLVVAMAILLLVGTAVVAGPLTRAREQANRAKCANNLRQVALAAIMYASNEIRTGSFPRTYFNTASDRLIVDTTGYGKPNSFDRDQTGDNNVPASFFLILKTQEIATTEFVCPSTGARPGFGRGEKVLVVDSSNWKEIPGNLSYNYACPFPSQAAIKEGWKFNNSLGSDYPLAADMNPGSDALPATPYNAAKKEMTAVNSANHAGGGQNVVYADAHVEFQMTPFCGAPRIGPNNVAIPWRDNIYTYGEASEKTGGAGVVGMPAGAWDMVLLPAGRPTRPTTQPAEKPRSPQALTLDEARDKLALNPNDPYLQYVALQLARREGRVDEVAEEVRQRTGRGGSSFGPSEQRPQVDLFGLFGGRLAIQESLQLETMGQQQVQRAGRFEGRPEGPAWQAGPPTTAPTTYPTTGPVGRGPGGSPAGAVAGLLVGGAGPAAGPTTAPAGPIPLASLEGPTVQSHPWAKMLAGKDVKVSGLALQVPADYYFVRFRSVGKMLDAAEAADGWGDYLAVQASQAARTHDLSARLRRQLALRAEGLLRPFYDQVVDEVGVTGSDPFVREGSDVTILFRLSQPALFKARADAFLDEATKSRPDAKRDEGQVLGVGYVHVGTPDRDVSVYSAYPAADLHVRSNSKAALEHVLAAMQNKGPALGQTDEFRYIRTLMPEGAAEEDGLVYLSDPFIRRLTGPKVRLTERRRLLCANHLQMIGHAALLYRTEFGKAPASLQALADTGCAPGLFGRGELACPDGGHYALAADGTRGACSVHGSTRFLTPCAELPLDQATAEEAEAYRVFVTDYNQYWRSYFDPIAVRLQVTPERFRVETLILPLIDNSIYTGLSKVLGGPPGHLDALPVPGRTIFSLAVKPNKDELLKQTRKDDRDELAEWAADLAGEKAAGRLNVREFLEKGVGDQIGVHAYDSSPAFDLSLTEFMSDLIAATAAGNGSGSSTLDDTFPAYALIAAGLTAPAYLSVPVKDANVVDAFLDKLDATLPQLLQAGNEDLAFGRVRQDYYRLAGGQPVRCYGLKVGPVRLRYFWARIGDGLYVASKRFILDDLAAADAARAKAGPGAQEAGPAAADLTGHALVRLRPDHWKEVLPDYRLAWAENNRRACLDNVALVSDVARAYAATRGHGGDKEPKPPGYKDGPGGVGRSDVSASTRPAGPWPVAPGEAPTTGPTGPGEAPPARSGIVPKPAPGADPPPAPAEAGDDAARLADGLYGVHFFCPDGGVYVLTPDGKGVTCSVHGSPATPRQPAAPSDATDAGRRMRAFAGLTATLTFREDGLHAVVTIDRKEGR